MLRGLEVLALSDGTTLDSAGSSGGDLSGLGTGTDITTDGTGVTHVLLVTTTVGMLHGVHGHASHRGPGVALDTEFVEGTAGLEHGLIGTSATGDDSDHGSASIDHGLLGSRGKTNSSNTLVSILCDNDGVVAGSTAHLSTVTDLGLDVANTGALGDLSKRKDVSDGDFGCSDRERGEKRANEKIE